MPGGGRAVHSASSAKRDIEKKPTEPRPSASVIILSPTNQVLLLHRVSTSSAFPSAHVFPGGNLSDFHDGAVPPPGDPKRHEDSLPYRLGAIRETFEESGILLARKGDRDGPLLELSAAERDKARRSIYANEVSFLEWLESIGGVADTDNLLPFTRWVTPAAQPRRFTTQMYIYMLPFSAGQQQHDTTLAAAQRAEAITPTPDGGAEITAARFDDAGAWLARQRQKQTGDGSGDAVVMFPPQCFLLHLLSQFLTGPPSSGVGDDESAAVPHYRAQRERLRGFLAAVPTATVAGSRAARHYTASIPWAEKVISPVTLGVRRHGDGRVILGLDKPGLGELVDSRRGGDWERVVLVRWIRGQARDIEIRDREEVLAEQREAEERAGASSRL
ncbi:hypothetical protein F5X99DRAFT_421787 [Biscogniauxia marginata]|nr:hypothetical protein F5X99DRAFT_421787 [Biscogniauxia marginata]